MKVIVPDSRPHTLLCDLENEGEFMYNGNCYIKHAPNGCTNGHYKVYNLTTKSWCSLGKCIVVIPCNFTITVKYL